MESNKLWNRNFTIITIGTVISMLGNAISGFAIGLLVLDYTKSVFLYSLFIVIYNLPKIYMPLLVGPYLDRFSRIKVIYTLDFISSFLYLTLFIILNQGLFNYWPFLTIALLIGTIDSTYQVAYDSLYPTLISREHYSKAYSISSMIYPISVVMIPVAAFVYERMGNLGPMFAFNAGTFLVAAIMETFIRAKETHLDNAPKHFGFSSYVADFRSGLKYIKGEKGLIVITAYFFFAQFAASSTALTLPYFKDTPGFGVLVYTYVMGCDIVGRLVGGLVHYKIHLPAARKFTIAVTVYAISSIIGSGYLYTPMGIMMLLMFINGFLSVNSYNIRISATQSYVPNELRGRFNGTFQMILSAGNIIGQLISGALGDLISTRTVIMIFYIVNFIAVFGIMIPGKKHVKPIYNAVFTGEIKDAA